MTDLRAAILARLSCSDPQPVEALEIVKMLQKVGELSQDWLEADIAFAMLMDAIEANYEVQGIKKDGVLYYVLTDLGKAQVEQLQVMYRMPFGQKGMRVC